MFGRSRVAPPVPDPLTMRHALTMRDHPVLAVFYGLVFDDVALIKRVGDRFNWVGDDTWELYEIGSFSAWKYIPAGALIHRASVVGDWWLDSGHAHPRGLNHLDLSSLSLVAPPGSAEPLLEDMRQVGLPADARVGWQVLSLVDLKHT